MADVEDEVEAWTVSGDVGNNIAPPPLPRPLPAAAAAGPSLPEASANLTGLWSLSPVLPPPPPASEPRMLVFDEKGLRWNERRGRSTWVCGDRPEGEGDGEGRSESISSRAIRCRRETSQSELVGAVGQAARRATHPGRGLRVLF